MRSGIESYQRPERSRRWPWLVGVLLLGAVGGLAVRYLRESRTEPPRVATRNEGALAPAVPDTVPPTTPAAEVPAEPATEEPLPPLADADDLVRQAVQALSSRPELVAWLGGTQLVQRFATTVENVAGGESPRPHLALLAPRD